jgi:gamma-glutamyl:cysteine ligase YbdK (ATP-grasp superfamily)
VSQTAHLRLFDGYGIELEYMIADRETLAVRPLSDVALTELNGGVLANEVEVGDLAWSNELVMHVLELKTNGPAPSLTGLADRFLGSIDQMNGILARKGAMLVPTAMHPLMRPETDTKLWPHDDAAVYEAYNRIFGCKGHGWSNLQSIHINLPFFDDREFGQLHAAIRLVLPILPALAASSPVFEGRVSGFADSRLDFYRGNQRAVPSITGLVIPERAFTRQEYHERIFARTFRDIAPHDPEGILQFEWLNSRGAIARFDRNAIEIRVLDIQESPRQDLAVIAAVVSAVQAHVNERWLKGPVQREWAETALRPIFDACVKDGSDARIADPAFLAAYGRPGAPVTAGALWQGIVGDLMAAGSYPLTPLREDVEALVAGGCLAKRIVKALGPAPSTARIVEVYKRLAQILAAGGRFDG